MSRGTIRPTTTQRVRAFLDANGVRLEPWSRLDGVYAELYRLLEARCDDARFWTPLQRLVSELVSDAASALDRRRLPAAGAELLRSWDIDDLIRDLKSALPGDRTGDGGGSALRVFFARLSAPALSGFLLLGLTAAKCDEGDGADEDAGADADTDTDTDTDSDTDSDSDSDSDSDADSDSDTDGDTDQECAPSMDACEIDHGSILWTAIEGATEIPESEKLCLCSCFAALDEGWTAGLGALFESATPEQTAAYLEGMVACCDYGYVDEPYVEGFDPTYCGAPAYKGVSFPSPKRAPLSKLL
jgi:hypothetical protein